MKSSSSSARRRVTRVLRIMVTAGLLSGFLSSLTASAQPAPPSPQATPAQTAPQAASQPPPAMSQEDWHATMSRTPLPKKGCFNATYPSMEWQEVPCVATPPYPQPPRGGPRTEVVGNGTDWVANVAGTGTISSTVGSFDSVTGVTSESGPIGNTGPSVANAYTLQLNTDFFPSTVSCAGSPNPACQGWQQFVFENYGSAGRVYIQYWLYKYNATCPANANWNQFSFINSTDIYCWKNDSMGATPVPAEPITTAQLV